MGKASKEARDVLNKINTLIEKDSVQLFTDTIISHKAIATGLVSLDYFVLGIGGFPENRIIEIFGSEASGKTTLVLTTIASVQASGGICLFIDTEHSLDIEYAQRLGVNIKDLLISQPDSGEEAINVAEAAIKTGMVRLIVIDSVAAITPQIGRAHV